jgi:hypothetical protein
VERVAEEEAEPGTGVGAGLDDELARDDPERLGDDEAGEERNEEVPGGVARAGSGRDGHVDD